MVENSLLDAYRKYNILRKRLYEGQYHEKLKKRLEFYEQEGMEDEYDEVYLAIQQFELLGYVGMRVVEQKTGDYKQSVVQLPEEELKGILDEIEYGEFIDKDLSMEELKEAFPKFTERFIAENEEYDLEGKLAEMDWGM